jgi:threonine/homoserine/homoserine lactone efflux protein
MSRTEARTAAGLVAADRMLRSVTALLLSGYGLGLFLAAQVGPVTLLIVRSVLRGGRAFAVGLAMAAAVALIDVCYAILGLAGIGRLLNGGPERLWLGLLSAAILVAIGTHTAWIGFRARIGLESLDDVVAPRRAFLTAIAATAFNPLTIALWTVSFPAAAPSRATTSTAFSAELLMGVGLGTLSWYGGFSTAVALVRKRVGDRLLRVVDVGSGCGLIGFGGLLGYRSLREHSS